MMPASELEKRLIVVGVSHMRTSFNELEKISVRKAELASALDVLKATAGLDEVVILSTCSRVEIIAAPRDPGDAAGRLSDWFSWRAGTALHPDVYTLFGAEAARHLFRVTAGLDSWIVGEPEILRQVKDAYGAAFERKLTGPILNRIFQKALAAGKDTRAATGLQNGIRSIGGAAALLSRKIFGDLDKGQLVVFGAGQVAEAVTRHLAVKNFTQIFVANRTVENARALAGSVGGAALSFEEGLAKLEEAEIGVFSTGSPDHLLTRDFVRTLLARRSRPLFLIDLGLPRNVDPACAELDGVYLYGLSDLKIMVQKSLESKAGPVAKAEEMVREAAEKSWRELENSAARAPRGGDVLAAGGGKSATMNGGLR